MTYRTVYLAGPILGCTDAEANDWRIDVAAKLKEHRIIGISPLRCEPLVGERYGLQYNDERFGTPRAIASKNLFDVMNCDMTLAYLPRPTEPGRYPSIGTIGEVHWAFAFRKPAIVVTDDPLLAEHPVLNACCAWKLPTLDDAVDVLVGVLGGYCGGPNNV